MLSITPVGPEDLSQTADMHKTHLKLGLFPRLGRNFLRHYQETFARSPYGIALVAKSEDGVVGALFGTTSNADHYSWVVKNCGWELALAGGSAMLLRPQLAWTFATTRMSRYMRGLSRYAAPATAAPARSSGPLSVLSHIVTSDAHRRQGIGRGLVEEFKARARAQGARRALLVTEEGGLGAPFFEKIGCDCVARRQGKDGATVREYRLTLDEVETHERIGHMRRSRPVLRPYHAGLVAAASFHGAGGADAR